MTAHPCGQRVDLLRRGYTGFMRMEAGADPIPVTWFRVPETRPLVKVPTPFRSRQFSDPHANPTGLGEYRPLDPPCDPCPDTWAACPPTFYDGSQRCGSDAAWRFGDTQGTVPVFLTNPDGSAPCCDPRPPCPPPPWSILATCCAMWTQGSPSYYGYTWGPTGGSIEASGVWPSAAYEFQGTLYSTAFVLFYNQFPDGSVTVSVSLPSMAPPDGVVIIPAGGDPCRTWTAGFTIPSVQAFNTDTGMFEIHDLVVSLIPGGIPGPFMPACPMGLPRKTQLVINGCPAITGAWPLGYTLPADGGRFNYFAQMTGGCRDQWAISVGNYDADLIEIDGLRLVVTAGPAFVTAIDLTTFAYSCSGAVATWSGTWSAPFLCPVGTPMTFNLESA